MHRTRLRQLVIDCSPETYDANVTFWSSALGARAETDPDDPDYAELSDQAAEITLLTQRLGEGESRLHLDIESDDIEAEVARLKDLGAEEVERISSWVVLRDPAGLVFCVINPQPGFADGPTTTWE